MKRATVLVEQQECVDVNVRVSAVLLAYRIPEGLLKSLANTSFRMSLTSALWVGSATTTFST